MTETGQTRWKQRGSTATAAATAAAEQRTSLLPRSGKVDLDTALLARLGVPTPRQKVRNFGPRWRVFSKEKRIFVAGDEL